MSISPTGTGETAVEAATLRLSPECCRSLLRQARDGYLALSRDALPIVVPVSCALDGESLLVRAGPGSLDRVTAQPGVVAFGTTIPSADGSRRWEVLVQGRAELVRHAAPGVPPRLPLTSIDLTTVFRLTLEVLTGWEHRPVPQSKRS
jgi:Pyridoxamine 5'-phosphate oxidase